MAEDFYIDDYGGGYYDGGYSDVSYLANGGGGYDYSYYDPFYEEVADQFLPFEPLPGELDFYPLPMPVYEPLPYIEPIPIDEQFFGLPYEGFEPLPDLPIIYSDPFFLHELYDPSLTLETIATQEPETLPYLSPMVLPYVPYREPVDIPDQFIEFPFIEPFPLPSPQTPLPCAGRTPDGHIPSCPAGYGRGPYGSDPCLCYPLPAPKPPAGTQPKPPTQTQSPAPKPTTQQQAQQQQQACPAGYCKHPQTGQCMPIPVGYARHPQTQVCVAASQVPASTEPDILASIKELPWWVWLAAGGVLLLSQGGGGRRR